MFNPQLNLSTLSNLRQQLVPALQPFDAILPVPLPRSAADIQLWEEKSSGQLAPIEDERAPGGWGRWKKVFTR